MKKSSQKKQNVTAEESPNKKTEAVLIRMPVEDIEYLKGVAEQWAAELVAQQEGLIKEKAESSGYSVSQACGDYFSARKNDISDRYRVTVADTLLKKIIPFFGENTPVSEIRAKQINEFRTHLLEKYNLKKQSANKILNVLNQVLKHCAENEEIDSIPYIKFFSYQKEEHGISLEKYQIDAVVEAARQVSPDALRIVALAIFSGLRRGEIVALDWKDVDFDKGIIRLKKQKNKTAKPAPLGLAKDFLLETPDKERECFVCGWFDHIHKIRRPVKEFRKTWITVKDLANKILADIPEAKQIPEKTRIHDMRHTFCTKCYQEFGLLEAKELTRHATSTVLAGYVHFDKEEIMSKVGDAFK